MWNYIYLFHSSIFLHLLQKGGFINVLVMQGLQVEHHFNKRGTAVGGAGPLNIHCAYVDTRRENDGGRFSLARRSWQLMCRSYVTPFISPPTPFMTNVAGRRMRVLIQDGSSGMKVGGLAAIRRNGNMNYSPPMMMMRCKLRQRLLASWLASTCS